MAKPIECDVVVIGSGPGGYSAAHRAADLGLQVVLVERYDSLGGVCLNVGCIPSKALLHVARVMDEAKHLGEFGVAFKSPKIDLKQVRAWKDKVVEQLTGGLKMMAKQRQVTVVHGEAKFADAHQLLVGDQPIVFKQAIIAAGSQPVKLPFIPEDARILDSTTALDLAKTDGEFLVLGGGIIGLEMATVYRALGAKVTIVELMDQLMPGADADLVKPFHQKVASQYEAILLETKVTSVEAKKDGLWVTFDGKHAPAENPKRFDQMLVSVGRRPNGHLLSAEKAGIQVDERGYIAVDKQMRTSVGHIYAIGDITGNPMLAHKASAEGRLAAEVIAGKRHYFDARCIPSVAYTDPEVAWVGLTEQEAKAEGIKLTKGVFPWMASGRALAMARSEGMTKLLFNEHGVVVGGGIVGVNAGDLIAEVALAIEMGCTVEDIALTIHPHPTLSESIMMAAEVAEGTVTDLPNPAAKKKKSSVH